MEFIKNNNADKHILWVHIGIYIRDLAGMGKVNSNFRESKRIESKLSALDKRI